MTDQPRPRWQKRRRALGCFGVVLALLLVAFTLVGGWDIIAGLRGPADPYDPGKLPPAPDYAKASAWMALPRRNGPERSTPPGIRPVDERTAPADVFFVHPTTFKGSPVWVAPFDAPQKDAPLNPRVLLDQVSVFNGCCRLFVPHYRQATLAGLKNPAAMDVAYGDVAAAFRFYVTRLNHGRPFIIASHSQGTAHAIHLLQQEILDTPLRSRLVAAYLIGGYVPDTFVEVGLPVCGDARQTGCVISYNTSQTGRTGARRIVDTRDYWWRGRQLRNGPSNAVCVNPLIWRSDGDAPATRNPGSLPFPKAPFASGASTLPPLIPALTGAACSHRLLDVDIPWSHARGFTDPLSVVFGSYHLNDYGIFYAALRRNAIERVAAWRPSQPAGGAMIQPSTSRSTASPIAR